MKKTIKGMMKIVCMMLAILIMYNISLTEANASASSDTEKIKKALESKIASGDAVVKMFYTDYDKNGRKEAFALTGTSTPSEWNDDMYQLWFAYVSNGVAKTVYVDTAMINSKMMKLKSATVFLAAQYAATSTPTDMYKVKGNAVEKIFEGDSITKQKGNNFMSIHSTYDASTDGTGHTWKPYYYYYKNGKVYQYTAKKISVSKFKKRYSNAKKILKKYKSRGKIVSIYYRKNKMIHINYRNGISNSNVSFTVKGRKLTNAREDAGIYLGKL